MNKQKKRYRFGNFNFGGSLTEEFMGGENTTDEQKEELLDLLEDISKGWNKALREDKTQTGETE